MIEHKNNAIINKLNKTKTEANNTPRELLVPPPSDTQLVVRFVVLMSPCWHN